MSQFFHDLSRQLRQIWQFFEFIKESIHFFDNKKESVHCVKERHIYLSKI
jgi:hypothetical protein